MAGARGVGDKTWAVVGSPAELAVTNIIAHNVFDWLPKPSIFINPGSGFLILLTYNNTLQDRHVAFCGHTDDGSAMLSEEGRSPGRRRQVGLRLVVRPTFHRRSKLLHPRHQSANDC